MDQLCLLLEARLTCTGELRLLPGPSRSLGAQPASKEGFAALKEHFDEGQSSKSRRPSLFSLSESP